MGKALIYSYDKRRYVLYVSVGQPREAISREDLLRAYQEA